MQMNNLNNIATNNSTRQTWMCVIAMRTIQGSSFNLFNSKQKRNKAPVGY